MSNIYKWQFTQSESDKRLIDNNQLLREKLAPKRTKTFRATSLDGEKPDGDFHEGLGAEELEVDPEMQLDYVEHAKEEAERIIAKAATEAEQILVKAKEEGENLKERVQQEAREQGYAQGQQQADAEAEDVRRQLASQREQQEQEYQRRLDSMERDLVQVIGEVFEKVLHIELEDRQDVLIHLVQKAVQQVKDSREYRVCVSEQDFPYVSDHKEELVQKLGGEVAVDIVSDESYEKGQCTIDTDSGIFDCSIDVELKNLTRELRELSCMDEGM